MAVNLWYLWKICIFLRKKTERNIIPYSRFNRRFHISCFATDQFMNFIQWIKINDEIFVLKKEHSSYRKHELMTFCHGFCWEEFSSALFHVCRVFFLFHHLSQNDISRYWREPLCWHRFDGYQIIRMNNISNQTLICKANLIGDENMHRCDDSILSQCSVDSLRSLKCFFCLKRKY